MVNPTATSEITSHTPGVIITHLVYVQQYNKTTDFINLQEIIAILVIFFIQITFLVTETSNSTVSLNVQVLISITNKVSPVRPRQCPCVEYFLFIQRK